MDYGIAEALLARDVPVQHHQRGGIGHRQRTHQQRVQKAENRRVRPNAERQREGRHQREPGIAQNRPRGVAKVLKKLLRERPAPRGTSILLNAADISQLQARRPPRLVSLEARFLKLLRFFLQMELQFRGELILLASTIHEPGQLAKKRVHSPS